MGGCLLLVECYGYHSDGYFWVSALRAGSEAGMSGDDLYPITERLRCQYLGRDFSGEMLVTLPTAIMLEAASRIEELEAEVAELRNQILDTGPMLPKRGMTLRYVE